MELRATLISEWGDWIIFAVPKKPQIESTGIRWSGQWTLRIKTKRLGLVATPKLMKWVLNHSQEKMIYKQYDIIIDTESYFYKNKKGNRLILKSIDMPLSEIVN